MTRGRGTRRPRLGLRLASTLIFTERSESVAWSAPISSSWSVCTPGVVASHWNCALPPAFGVAPSTSVASIRRPADGGPSYTSSGSFAVVAAFVLV